MAATIALSLCRGDEQILGSPLAFPLCPPFFNIYIYIYILVYISIYIYIIYLYLYLYVYLFLYLGSRFPVKVPL